MTLSDGGPGEYGDLAALGLDAMDLWQAARASFDDVTEAVDRQINELVAALRASDDAELQDIAEMGLNALTMNVRVPLQAALMEVKLDPAALAASRPKILRAMAAFRGKLASDPRIEACDGNPFGVEVDIVGTYGAAFEQMEDALSIIGRA